MKTGLAALAMAVLVACATSASANERRDGGVPDQRYRFPGTTPLPIPPSYGTAPSAPTLQPKHYHRVPGHRSPAIVLPPPVYYYYAPPRPAGSWSYQWVPRYYEVPTWVPAHWSPDGQWVEGRYESRWMDYGNWEPYWVPAY